MFFISFPFFLGGLIYLLDLFCNSPNPNVRDKTAELLAKMQTDKLMGPRIRILLCKFLPPIFMDAMRDSHEASIHMFEGRSSYEIHHSILDADRKTNGTKDTHPTM